MKYLILPLLIALSLNGFAETFNTTDPLLVTAQLIPLNLNPGQSGELKLNVKLPDHFHAYAEQFKISITQPEGFLVGPIKIEPLKTWFDKFSKRQRSGVEKEATLTIPVEAPSQILTQETSIKFSLTYQACSETFCLFPTTKQLETPWDFKTTGTEKNEAPTQPQSIFSIEGFKKALATSTPLAFILAFIAGILTSFTPCIFPMIPITLAILGHHAEERTRAQNFLLTLIYVFGIAITYASLGLLAVKTGSLFGSTLGNPWIVGVLCSLMLAMSLSLFGLFELQVPAVLRNRFGRGHNKNGHLGAFISGLFAGLVASPCVGPILVAILAFVATQASYVLGFFLLFTYALGLGFIFLLLGAFSELSRKLPRSGVWMEGVKIFLGLLMLSGFYYYLQFVFSDRLWNLAFGLGLIIFSSRYGAFEKKLGAKPIYKIRKGLMLAMFIVGILYSTSGAVNWPHSENDQIIDTNFPADKKLKWQNYSSSTFEAAKINSQPIMIDFWAEWCAACHELEQFTFTNPKVRELSEKFVLLKFDATKNSPELKSLKQKYKIQGLPSVIFINSQGQWLESLTLTEYEKPEKFSVRMQKALTQQ